MSLSLSNVQQTEFDALVKIEYRSRGFLLRETMRIRTDVIGNVCSFRKVGQVIANAVAYQNTIAIQDPGFTKQDATLIKYAAGCAVDEIQDLTVNFDSKRELAMVVAMAIGRRADQIGIDAIIAGYGAPAQPVIAAGGSNMSYAKLRNILQYFEQDAVPVGERFMALSGNNLRALLADDHIISRFYTSNDLVVNGDINYKQLVSMNPIVIPDMTEGGLPFNTAGSGATVRNCFAWHKMAMGFAIGQDMRTEVNYLPRETSWFVNGLFFAGAVIVDNRGVFFVNADESVNP